jgi:hypothetical protein
MELDPVLPVTIKLRGAGDGAEQDDPWRFGLQPLWTAAATPLWPVPIRAALASGVENTSVRAWINPALEKASAGIGVAGVSVIVRRRNGHTRFSLRRTEDGRLARRISSLPGRSRPWNTSGLGTAPGRRQYSYCSNKPSLDNLTALALNVLIRAALSFSLEVEIEGRWPRRRAKADQEEGGSANQGDELENCCKSATYPQGGNRKEIGQAIVG